jgi:hypothetical protein
VSVDALDGPTTTPSFSPKSTAGSLADWMKYILIVTLNKSVERNLLRRG